MRGGEGGRGEEVGGIWKEKGTGGKGEGLRVEKDSGGGYLSVETCLKVTAVHCLQEETFTRKQAEEFESEIKHILKEQKEEKKTFEFSSNDTRHNLQRSELINQRAHTDMAYVPS